ncbi:MAG: DUF5615 family PIN-like protein [Thermomicrobiales bacterium]
MAAVAFVLDENVTHRLASLLRSYGWSADSAKELGRLGLSDVQALLSAADDGRTFITHNSRDFRALHEAWVTWRQRWLTEAERQTGVPVGLSRHGGILIVPPLPIYDLAGIIMDFATATDPPADRLFAWSAARNWQEWIVQ